MSTTAPRGDRHPTVVWDLGNVLIPWDRSRALEVAFGDATEARRLAEQVLTMELNALIDAASDRTALLESVALHSPGSEEVVEAYLENFAHSLGAVIEGSAAILDELCDAGVRCVALSNFSAITFAGVPQRFPVLERMEGILISGDVGLTKPDPAIYLACARRFSLRSDETVFIDDSPANVAAARELGWDAVHFTDPQHLRAALVDRHLPLGAR